MIDPDYFWKALFMAVAMIAVAYGVLIAAALLAKAMA